jgi:hypothetical protein
LGLIHSRASKQRDREEAKLIKAQREALQDQQAADLPWYRQRTLGAAITTAIADKK